MQVHSLAQALFLNRILVIYFNPSTKRHLLVTSYARLPAIPTTESTWTAKKPLSTLVWLSNNFRTQQ